MNTLDDVEPTPYSREIAERILAECPGAILCSPGGGAVQLRWGHWRNANVAVLIPPEDRWKVNMAWEKGEEFGYGEDPSISDLQDCIAMVLGAGQ